MKARRVAAVVVATAILLIGVIVTLFGTGGNAHGHRSAISTVTEPATRTSARTAVTPMPSTTVPPGPTVTVAPGTSPASTIGAPATAPPAQPTQPAVTSPPPPPATGAPVAAPATSGLGALRGRTIAIDPGHNGRNYAHSSEIARPVYIGTQTRACDTTGTETDGGYTEAAYTLDVALRLRDVLQAAGANVVMSRTTNDGWGPCIDERAAFANRAHADAAISIHADGGPPDGRGFHVLMPALIPGYTDDIYSASHRLGVDVRDAFLTTGMPTSTYYASQGLAERTDLGGLNLSNVPKVFIETGNMRNATDAALLGTADFRERAAHALAAGIARYLTGS